jgi:PAS domain S-box-containing protein
MLGDAMRKNDSAWKVRGLLRRIRELQEHAAGGGSRKSAAASKCIDQLHCAIEEIRAAEEQLKLRSEQLLATCQASEEGRRHYQELFDCAPDGYLVTDSRGIIREANRAAGQLLKVSPSCLPGTPLVTFVAREDRRAFMAELSPSAQNNEVRTKELHLRPRRAAPFVAQLTMVREVDRAGKVIGRRWLFCDVTARKRADEMQRELAVRAQEALRLESLSTLAGGLAHDFNNLLMIILGNAELAAKHLEPDAPAAVRIAHIRKAGKRAAELVAEMLAFAGQGQTAVVLQDLGDVVRNMADLLKASIPRKAVLRVDCPPRLPPVLADPAQVRHMLLNLVANASEAIGDRRGSINVAISTLRADRRPGDGIAPQEKAKGNRYVCLRVRDSGCGMDKEVQARMFEPFFSTKVRGRGLGLAAVAGIVKKHNGAVKVSSAEGKGTTVEVLLPAAGAGQ